MVAANGDETFFSGKNEEELLPKKRNEETSKRNDHRGTCPRKTAAQCALLAVAKLERHGPYAAGTLRGTRHDAHSAAPYAHGHPAGATQQQLQ